MDVTEFLGLINSCAADNIMVAAGDGDIEKVRAFLDNNVDPNQQDNTGYSAMHAAAAYGNLDVLQLLISRGGNVHLKDSDGDTPLHTCEDRACAECLLANGARYDTPNNEGKTPIWYAVEEEFEMMIEYYLEKGILTPELIQRIQADIEKDSDCFICYKQTRNNNALIHLFI